MSPPPQGKKKGTKKSRARKRIEAAQKKELAEVSLNGSSLNGVGAAAADARRRFVDEGGSVEADLIGGGVGGVGGRGRPRFDAEAEASLNPHLLAQYEQSGSDDEGGDGKSSRRPSVYDTPPRQRRNFTVAPMSQEEMDEQAEHSQQAQKARHDADKATFEAEERLAAAAALERSAAKREMAAAEALKRAEEEEARALTRIEEVRPSTAEVNKVAEIKAAEVRAKEEAEAGALARDEAVARLERLRAEAATAAEAAAAETAATAKAHAEREEVLRKRHEIEQLVASENAKLSSSLSEAQQASERRARVLASHEAAEREQRATEQIEKENYHDRFQAKMEARLAEEGKFRVPTSRGLRLTLPASTRHYVPRLITSDYNLTTSDYNQIILKWILRVFFYLNMKHIIVDETLVTFHTDSDKYRQVERGEPRGRGPTG